ncbi:MAG TPA: hypothetical protein VLA77_00980 [Candidatus Saccharimonadales bacterium]|nr:hypothetical protein [Candidatus Saccharimonadales bacterium]
MTNKSKGFSVIALVSTIVALLVLGFITFRFWSSQKSETQQSPSITEALQENNQSPATPIPVEEWIVLSDFGVKISKPTEEISYGSLKDPAYGSDLGSIDLYIPKHNNDYICVSDGTTDKALFATIAQFNIETETTGPYPPSKVIEVGDKKYAIFRVASNCYAAEVNKKIESFYASFIASLKMTSE